MKLDIHFGNLESSPALTEQVRHHADRLDRAFPRTLRCEVSIENTHRSHHHGPRFRVRIHVALPAGPDVEVSRDKGDHEDAHVAVADAFEIARRQLVARAAAIRGDHHRRRASDARMIRR